MEKTSIAAAISRRVILVSICAIRSEGIVEPYIPWAANLSNVFGIHSNSYPRMMNCLNIISSKSTYRNVAFWSCAEEAIFRCLRLSGAFFVQSNSVRV